MARLGARRAIPFLLWLALSGCGADPAPPSAWEASTPEEQGMDSRPLRALVDEVRSGHLTLHAVLVLRHGRLVLEQYFGNGNRGTLRDWHSVTKSITSTLVGMAIQDGFIGGVQDPVGKYLPDAPAATAGLTLEELLTMSSGLRWEEHTKAYTDPANTFVQMVRTSDWTRFVLSQPLAEPPGTSFNYCTGCSHVLSAVVQEATGKTTLDYARERLFGPLGITSVRWGADPAGVTQGGSDLHLTPQDAAKLGQLMLQGGRWNGEQLVPAEWVAAATARQVETAPRFADWGEDCSAGYGYQWWMNPFGGYRAFGIAGQYVIVVPELDLVVVLSNDDVTGDSYTPIRLTEQYILPAILDRTPPAQ